MAFMRAKKRYKFEVAVTLEELTEVPFVSAVLFAKLRLLDGGSFQEHSPREEVRNHAVVWRARYAFVCKMCANASTGVLEPALLRVSVRKECKGGRSYVKLGFCDVNLAELAGAGESSRRCLLEGYDPRRRQDNSVLHLTIRMNMIAGDPLFKVPERSKQELPVEAGSGTGVKQGPAGDSGSEGVDDDCASSTASSGFGSLPKKRNNEIGSAVGSAVTSQPAGEPPSPEPDDTLIAPLDHGGTLSAQGVNNCVSCLQQHSHSRNSSNTSGDMSSKASASGYGSSGSGGAHSRHSSDGDDHPPHRAPHAHNRNPSSGSLTASASESGSLERARAAAERRKRTAPPPAPAPPADEQSVASCRVETTRVNPDSLIDELLAATDLTRAAADPHAESSGLQLFIDRDGTTQLGSRPRPHHPSHLQRVVVHPADTR